MMAKKIKAPKLSERSDIFVPPNAVHLYTDGSMRPPNNAASAYLLFSEKTQHVIRAEACAFRDATINQVELQAINRGLDYAGDYVIIYSDSQYSISALTVWRKAWANNNWLNGQGEPVKNKELIQEIGAKIDKKKFVRFFKIKAHSGNPFNSMVDFMAQQLTDLMRDKPDLQDGPYP